MRQEASFFEGKDAVLVYIAKRLNEALRLEAIFSSAGVDYGVEADEYRGGFIFQRVRTGAFFYVLPDAAEDGPASAAGKWLPANRTGTGLTNRWACAADCRQPGPVPVHADLPIRRRPHAGRRRSARHILLPPV